jgi:squalene-hopene/tetraprenyl-beta-curcumene cyclase
LDLGLRWMENQQHEDGSWAIAQHPALTALAVMTFCLDPRREPSSPLPPAAKKGVEYIMRCVQPDGGIYVPSDQGPAMPHYNTAISLSALIATGDERYRPVIAKAQQFLVAGQHLGSDIFNGGYGYDTGTNRNYADLSSTYMVLEAVRASEVVLPNDVATASMQRKLDWDAALQFLSRVQNLPASNDQAWAKQPTPDDLGGFVYHPGESKAGDEMSEDGSRRFHSYGSMSYAGLLSFIYAQVDRQDPRVLAAVDWIQRHYTVKENPGMGPQGLYYSYHTMAKALSNWGENPLKLTDGTSAWWRKDLAEKLITLQRIDSKTSLGYWVNDNGRWWENEPVLATSYALIAMEVSIGPALRH